MANNEYEFSLCVSYKQCEQLYMQGNNSVVVLSTTGVRISLPAKNLRPFVSTNGIHARFRLVTSAQNKIISLTQISTHQH
ncbi:DUF2835 family protein [Alteromonas facilis]|uniref:DUF2835 family protein n=1 Tax=Alteromonas facilis TaxID=2048004 RepID=UPI000C284B56|nr:DUF2835 family protein [Alteromonas facilis]